MLNFLKKKKKKNMEQNLKLIILLIRTNRKWIAVDEC